MAKKTYKYNKIDFEKQLADFEQIKEKISNEIFPLDDEQLQAAVKEQMPDEWEKYKEMPWDVLAFLLYQNYLNKWFFDEFAPNVLDEFLVLREEHIAAEKGLNEPYLHEKVGFWYATHPEHNIPECFRDWWVKYKDEVKEYNIINKADDAAEYVVTNATDNRQATTQLTLVNNLEFKTAIRSKPNKKHKVKFNKNNNLDNYVLLEIPESQVELLKGGKLTREKHESVANAAFNFWLCDGGKSDEIAIPYNLFAEQMGVSKKYLAQSKNRKRIHGEIDDAIIDIMSAVFSCKTDEQLTNNDTIEDIYKAHLIEVYTGKRLYKGQWTECVILHKMQPFFDWCKKRRQIITIPKRIFTRLNCFGEKEGDRVTRQRSLLIQEMCRFMYSKTTGNNINIKTLAERAGFPIGKNAARDLQKCEDDVALVIAEWKDKNILYREFGYVDYEIKNKQLRLFRKPLKS